jgi:hypothetical protein
VFSKDAGVTLSSGFINDAGAEDDRWRYYLQETPVSVRKATEETIPTHYSLSQNYPNPFNPSTTISYSLPKTAVVSLRIFNTLGQEVSMLVNERKEPGYYQTTWNANVPSGIYFNRLQAGGFVETKKMILLR